MSLDALIIGAGPAGVTAGAALVDAGLATACYDKGALAQAITEWPVYMRFFSTAANVELPGFPLIITEDKPTREEYLNYLRRFVTERNVPIVTGHRAERIEKSTAGGFFVSGTDEWGERFRVAAGNIVVATGAYEIPKLLNVPGEQLHKVSHYYKEVHSYVRKRVAVIGGRNGAAEAALLLWRAGAEVTLVYRGKELRQLKWWLEPDLMNRIQNKEIRALFGATVLEIRPHHLIVRDADGETLTLDNDFVLAMTGYRPDTTLLRDAGVQVDPCTNRPVFDPATLQTNVPGLYVAGVIAAGDISNEIFIENSREHGALIRNSILRARAVV